MDDPSKTITADSEREAGLGQEEEGRRTTNRLASTSRVQMPGATPVPFVWARERKVDRERAGIPLTGSVFFFFFAPKVECTACPNGTLAGHHEMKGASLDTRRARPPAPRDG